MLVTRGPFQRVPVGGSMPPINPLTFPGLQEYYDSRTPTGSNGANVNTWADLSGNARTQGVSDPSTTVPTLRLAASPKGVNLVRFTVAANSAMTSGTLNPFPSAALGWTYYIYGNFGTSAGAAAIWATSAFGSAPQELSLVRAATTGWRDSGGFHLPIAPNLTGIHQLAYVFTPPSGVGTCQLYVDGVATGLPAVWTVGGAAADVTMLGNTINFNTPLPCDMGHFLWYSRAHDARTVFSFWKRFALQIWGQ